MNNARSKGATASNAPAIRLNSLQAGRGLAALLVVLFHNNEEVFYNQKYWPTNPLPLVFDFGHAGAEYFFVLSGFVILYTHWADIGCPQRIMHYLWRRVIRVYPVYWIVLGAVFMVYFLVPKFGEGWEREPSSLLSSIFLITWRMHDYAQPLSILVVAWTLYHEVLFYLLFAASILNFRIGAIFLISWFASSLILLLITPSKDVYTFYFAPVHLLFALGMGAAWLIRITSIPMPRLVAAAGVLIFGLSAIGELFAPVFFPRPFGTLLYGLGSVLVVLGFAELERAGYLRVPRFLLFVGDASYSIYLLHLPVLILATKVVSSLPMHASVPSILWYACFPCVAVTCGTVLHLIVERPILRYLKDKI